MKKSPLRKLLDQRGLSLKTGADLIGCSRRQMAYYVAGTHPIKPDQLKKLEDYKR